MAQLVENLAAMRETQVRYLHWKDTLEKEMVILFSVFAWRIPWTEEPVHGQRATLGTKESDMAERLPLHFIHGIVILFI